ncbi:MAG: DUF2764 family protein [Actinobacteria bacterium]|nr:DUF2764 family protein [Actinomycetota bacterium]
MDYVYLVVSLPHLDLAGVPPFSSTELLFSCGGVLRQDHWEDLRAIVEGRPRDVRAPEARRLVDAETQLRNALARIRAQRAGVEYAARSHPHAGFDARAEEVAARALAIEDPLERELMLDRHRLALLEEVAVQPAFGVQAVFAYALKLRLVEKWIALSDQAGLDVALQVVESNLVGSSL